MKRGVMPGDVHCGYNAMHAQRRHETDNLHKNRIAAKTTQQLQADVEHYRKSRIECIQRGKLVGANACLDLLQWTREELTRRAQNEE